MFDQSVYDRLVARSLKAESGCWLWTGPVRATRWDANRYGVFSVYRGGKRIEQTTHRAMWYALHGKPEKGLCVCHSCDVPTCVNPDHLWLGTKRDNTMDMVRKRRHHLNRKTVCKNGHVLSGDNVYVEARGYRHCRQCHRDNQNKRWRIDLAFRARKSARRKEREQGSTHEMPHPRSC